MSLPANVSSPSPLQLQQLQLQQLENQLQNQRLNAKSSEMQGPSRHRAMEHSTIAQTEKEKRAKAQTKTTESRAIETSHSPAPGEITEAADDFDSHAVSDSWTTLTTRKEMSEEFSRKRQDRKPR